MKIRYVSFPEYMSQIVKNAIFRNVEKYCFFKFLDPDFWHVASFRNYSASKTNFKSNVVFYPLPVKLEEVGEMPQS